MTVTEAQIKVFDELKLGHKLLDNLVTIEQTITKIPKLDNEPVHIRYDHRGEEFLYVLSKKRVLIEKDFFGYKTSTLIISFYSHAKQARQRYLKLHFDNQDSVHQAYEMIKKRLRNVSATTRLIQDYLRTELSMQPADINEIVAVHSSLSTLPSIEKSRVTNETVENVEFNLPDINVTVRLISDTEFAIIDEISGKDIVFRFSGKDVFKPASYRLSQYLRYKNINK